MLHQHAYLFGKYRMKCYGLCLRIGNPTFIFICRQPRVNFRGKIWWQPICWRGNSKKNTKMCTKKILKFKYLRETISSNSKSETDIDNKIASAIRIKFSWTRIWPRKTRSAIYYTIVEAICTYEAETWKDKKQQNLKI